MLSFTFDSDSESRHHRAAWLFVAGLLVLCALTEVFAGFVLDRTGATQQRINSQLPVVVSLRQGGMKPSILIVGNSLMAEGINTHLLNADLQTKYKVAPFFIEATSYYDWYYGLRRLFAQGARPDVVVVSLPAAAFLETQVRPDYFSATLLDRRDILRVARDVHYSRTEMTTLFAGTISRFWGHRGVIRTRALSTIFPDANQLALGLGRLPRPNLTDAQIDDQLQKVATSRVIALGKLCAEYNAQLVVLFPPVSNGNDHLKTFSDIAAQADARVVVPIPSRTLSPSDYRDGLHLRPELVDTFTDATAHSLEGILRTPAQIAQGPIH